ncbi:uncharacterized protein LOC143151809 [Ptiloglossa arizonensis]|uniref:uncharacterized protein LOC143151809 n=1 Tax=Ptiloglossa arizonensis TaxID=3350558 RepID=UPI003FA08260
MRGTGPLETMIPYAAPEYGTRIKTVTTVAILRYQESKRVCCENTFSPISSVGNQPQDDDCYRSTIRKPKEGCDLRKCKYAKSQAASVYFSTQKLLDKIQNLKRDIQDLETVRPRSKQSSSSRRRRDVPCQTPDLTVIDLNNVREVLNNCITQMTKLKVFLDDDNCWWKMFKNQRFECCEQKVAHLHGYLDGSLVTLRMMEEPLDPEDRFTTSTPIRSNSLTMFGRKVKTEPKQRSQNVEHYTYTLKEDTRKFRDSGIGANLSFESSVSKSQDTCQPQCPVTCRPGDQECKLPETKDETPELDCKTSPTDELRREPVRFTRDLNDLVCGSKPRSTFNSENTTGSRTIVADVGTSMDLIVVLSSTDYRRNET